MVGRTGDTARVRELLTAAARRHGGGIHVVAAPGGGRTRVLEQAVEAAIAEGMRVVRVGSVHSERQIAWAGVSQLVVALRTTPR
ncbi:MAG TPA: hypothetical protein VNQ73_23320 [Ilumatobacter sp.]|nr:hypothetical protein [Ilumatobacter sp.]